MNWVVHICVVRRWGLTAADHPPDCVPELVASLLLCPAHSRLQRCCGHASRWFDRLVGLPWCWLLASEELPNDWKSGIKAGRGSGHGGFQRQLQQRETRSQRTRSLGRAPLPQPGSSEGGDEGGRWECWPLDSRGIIPRRSVRTGGKPCQNPLLFTQNMTGAGGGTWRRGC